MPSCDDTASSDTDCQSQVSSTAHLHSYRSNGLVEPPSKRRLTTTNETSLSSAGATAFQIESPGSISAITTNNSTTSAGDSNNSNSFSDQHSRHPRTPKCYDSPLIPQYRILKKILFNNYRYLHLVHHLSNWILKTNTLLLQTPTGEGKSDSIENV